jgi:hypothetical protein
MKPDSMFGGKVAFLTNQIRPYRVPLLRALAERVADLRVFVSSKCDTAKGEAFDIVRTPSIQLPLLRGTGRSEVLDLPYTIIPQVTRYKPDIIVSAELGARTFQAAACAYLRKVPLVIWADLSDHTERDTSPLRRALRPWLLSRASSVVVNGAGGARYIKQFGIPQERIFLSPYATDAATFGRPQPATEVGEYLRVL